MKRSILTLAVLVLPFLAIAKGKKYNNISLDSLSEEFLYNINDNFLVVDAYSDGLIQEGKPYDISVYKTNVSVNGKALPAKLGKKYATKLNEYWNKYEVSADLQTIKIHSDKLDMNAVCKVFVKRYMPAISKPASTEEQLKAREEMKDSFSDILANLKDIEELAKNLCSDMIIRQPMDVHLRYNTDDVWVNGKMMNKRFTKKYLTLISKVVKKQAASASEYIGYTVDSRDIRAQLSKKS